MGGHRDREVRTDEADAKEDVARVWSMTLGVLGTDTLPTDIPEFKRVLRAIVDITKDL